MNAYKAPATATRFSNEEQRKKPNAYPHQVLTEIRREKRRSGWRLVHVGVVGVSGKEARRGDQFRECDEAVQLQEADECIELSMSAIFWHGEYKHEKESPRSFLLKHAPLDD